MGLKGKIVEDYLKEWANLPNLTLAKKIYNENKEVFKDVDSVRGVIRYQKGNKGWQNRGEIKDNKYFETPGHSAIQYGVPNPYGLPESEEQDWEPFVIPPGNGNIMILPDIHFPYHNIQALTAALDYASSEKLTAIVLSGDTMDCYALSRYEKDPRKRGFAYELEITRGFLQMLQDKFQCPIYYKIGNHEERYEAFLKIKAPELLGVSDFRLETLLQMRSFGCQMIESKQVIKAGKLRILHGHEFGRSVFSPVNPARGYYMRAKRSMIAGHNHQTSEHSENNLDGDVVTTWSMGCLCELHPHYMPINKWNHGAAHVTVQPDGSFEVHNFRIIGGKIY